MLEDTVRERAGAARLSGKLEKGDRFGDPLFETERPMVGTWIRGGEAWADRGDDVKDNYTI